MPGLATVDWEQARSAVAAIAPRVTDVLRSVRDPEAPALGEWNVAELATHLTQVWEVLPRLAWMDKGLPPQLEHIDDLAEFTVAMVNDEPERDLRVLANRIEAAAAEFTGAIATATGDERCPWLVQGSTVSLATLVCHGLGLKLRRLMKHP